jgi:NDP-sugar pyrophosphorylase family protein
MKALILAGGKGTRLRPLTVYQPKPIVPFVNRPFLIYQIEILRRAGIEDITLSLNYQPDKIRHLLGAGADFGVNLTYVTEPSPMGTAGAYRYALGDSMETTVVLNGDILTDLIVKNLLNSHIDSKSAATICLYGVSNPSTYGVVKTDENGSVTAFREKPKTEELNRNAPSLINAGIYVLEPEILNLVPKNKNCSVTIENRS